MICSFRALAALPILLSLITFTAQTAAGQADDPDEKTRYEYAQTLYMQGAYDSALTEFTDFINDYPKGEYTDDAYYWLGVHYMKTGRKKDGQDQFKIILALMPDADKAPAAQFELAYYWYDPSVDERDLERAIAEFMKIPYFYPESSLTDDAIYYAALSQVELGRYKQAESELKDFMEKYPGSEFAAPGGYRLGIAYILDGKPGEALAALQAVRDKYPAGLYAGKALEAAEMVARARDKSVPALAYKLGGKGDAPGKMYKPMDAAWDEEGGLYVADTGNSRVQRYKLSAGKMELETSSISPPTLDKELMMDEPASVAVGPAGRLYVADRGLHRVQAYDPDKGLLLTFGKKGDGPGELNNPAGIAVDAGGFVYVADRGNSRVSVFDSSGRFERSLGAEQAGTDKALKSPVGVAIGIRGELLVVDNSTDRVYGYDSKGELAMLYGKDPSGKFELKDPSGISVDRAGNIYVADADRDVIIMFDMDLHPLMEFPEGGDAFDRPSSLAVSGSGELFVCDSGENQVVVLK